jgi:hypothetical protein
MVYEFTSEIWNGPPPEFYFGEWIRLGRGGSGAGSPEERALTTHLRWLQVRQKRPRLRPVAYFEAVIPVIVTGRVQL